MTGKFKIILSVISVVSVLSLCSCGKAGTAATTTAKQTTAIWENVPVDFSTEPETTYASCEEPFSNAFELKSYELSESSIEFDSAYIRTVGNSLAVESYVNSEGKYEFFICKFKDGRVREQTVKTDLTKFTTNNNLLIDQDSDMIVVRYYIDKETIRQIIYDYSDDDYIAVRDKNFGYDDTESMEAAVTEYKAGAKNFLLFSECSEKDDITGYVEENLSTTSE